MLISSELDQMLRQELAADNSVNGEYVNQFANCKTIVILNRPFRVGHAPSEGVEEFVNRDTHYPVGRGYKDNKRQEILMAPLS